MKRHHLPREAASLRLESEVGLDAARRHDRKQYTGNVERILPTLNCTEGAQQYCNRLPALHGRTRLGAGKERAPDL